MTRESIKPATEGQFPNVSITLMGDTRQIDFEKECLDRVEIHRRVNNSEWLCIARGVSSPYVDKDRISSPATIEYHIRITDQKGKERSDREFKVNV